MIENRTVLKVSTVERVYELHVDPASPLPEILQVLEMMKNYCEKLLQERTAQKEKLDAQEPQKEVEKKEE